ncbi:hypothetical protein AAFF_G00226730 [Aldrovandia affinis]|uniref:Uncharacterized protein n=1 Tax=Aldrovandia affinis TaxID=143900 RepID=A0AAD7TBE9_9TELE|nr:hypothetical protein AAFF_G00226730 [Aldrovandia affinis]
MATVEAQGEEEHNFDLRVAASKLEPAQASLREQQHSEELRGGGAEGVPGGQFLTGPPARDPPSLAGARGLHLLPVSGPKLLLAAQ